MIFDQYVKLEIPIDCLPVALRALGHFPTEAEMQDILNEFGDSKKGKSRSNGYVVNFEPLLVAMRERVSHFEQSASSHALILLRVHRMQ